jgi:hypothetical protein
MTDTDVDDIGKSLFTAEENEIGTLAEASLLRFTRSVAGVRRARR